MYPGRGTSLVWQSGLRSLGERQKDKKAWVSGLLEKLHFKVHSGSPHPQQAEIHPWLTLDGFAEPLKSASDQRKQEEYLLEMC